jgi:flagellar FliJ protein
MAFRFPLAAVLKLRESIERREYLALGRVHQEISQVDAQIRLVEQWCAAAAETREKETARGVASVHLQDAYDQELSLEKQRNALRATRQELKIKLQQCIKAYEIARQKREVLDSLRGRQFEAYKIEQARLEQSRIDDLFLARRQRDR